MFDRHTPRGQNHHRRLTMTGKSRTGFFMAYHIDAENASLDDQWKRVETTDLVPSRASLLEGIDGER